MTSTPKADAQVLIVEDDPVQSRAIELTLSSISEEILISLGIHRFRIDKAASVNQAMKYLDEAGETPYDICLLDLSLPQNEGDKTEIRRGGYEIMKHVMKIGAARKVIVVSVFSEYQYVIEALRGGAFDFIAKPYDEDNLRAQALNCLGRLLTEECNRILEQRIKDLIPYAENGLAYRFTTTFSTLINSVTRATDKVEKYARKHYGINPEKDTQNELTSYLRAFRESVNAARQEWAKLQALPGDGEQPQVKTVEDMLNEINESLRPCFIVKKTRLLLAFPRTNKSPALTFQEDARAVLKEIIAGGLSKLPDYGKHKNIKVTVEKNDARVIVRFEDDLTPISKADADKINEGYSIIPDPELGRVWGLSVAQHIAWRGGGEFIVEPKPRGNTITYRIPMANHEKDTRG